MKFLFQLILTVIFSVILQMFLPFWSSALAAFVIAFLFQLRGRISFIAGFLAIFLVWAITAYLIDMDTSSILTDRIAKLFSVSNTVLILITALIGGLVGGFSAMTGSQFVRLFKNERKGYYR